MRARDGSGVMALRDRRRATAIALIAAAFLQAEHARAADTIDVVLDQAKIVKLPDRVGTIVVGNPLIADVSVQPGGMLVVTGKGYGRTNIIVLDRGGNVLVEKAVQMQARATASWSSTAARSGNPTVARPNASAGSRSATLRPISTRRSTRPATVSARRRAAARPQGPSPNADAHVPS